MDIIQVIVSTLAAGAIAGLRPVAEKAVKDSYLAIKQFVIDKYNERLDDLEKEPTSTSTTTSLGARLRQKGASDDTELVDKIQNLFNLLAKKEPAALAKAAIDLEQVKAAFLNINDVNSSGAAVKVRDAEFTGGIDISNIRAGKTQNP